MSPVKVQAVWQVRLASSQVGFAGPLGLGM